MNLFTDLMRSEIAWRCQCFCADLDRLARALDNQQRPRYPVATLHNGPMQYIEDLQPWVLM